MSTSSQRPPFKNGRFHHFDPGERFWTPAWDYENNQPRDVEAVELADGTLHEFPRFVSRAEAGAVYLATALPKDPTPSGEDR